MVLTKHDLLNEYNIFKKEAFIKFNKGEYLNTLNYIELCAKLAYSYNFIYHDDELEILLSKISYIILPKPTFENRSRFVFYDYFGFDNQGLTQQYLRALISWNVEFLYILETGEQFQSTSSILKELKEYSKAEVLILNGGKFEKIQQAYDSIVQYKPDRAILHFAPWDTIGVCLWSNFENVQKFFINLTDHAFWLGKICSNFIIEFRTYGLNLSIKARGIAQNNLLMLPYYPIQSDSHFGGFELDFTNKVVGFSGAALHKIYGRNGKFLELIKGALDDNPNFIFLMAGEGYIEPLLTFIKENNFEDRFILLGHRKDIDQVIKNIDIFINTYPISGGLITQLAVLNHKSIISYSSSDLPVNYVEDFLNVDRTKVFTLKDEIQFRIEINKLISDKNYREYNSQLYQGCIPTVEEFNSNLFNIIYEPLNYTVKNFHNIPIDFEADHSVYLEIENNFYRQFDLIKFKYLGIGYFKLNPIRAIKGGFYIFFLNFNIIKKLIKRFFN